ncbi:MAG: hypothetical protein AAGF60_10155 [Pseudomonadota bacterium]
MLDWLKTLFNPPGPRYRIDPVAFILALVAAPLIVTALTFPIGGFSFFVLLFGAPLYLVIGTPLLVLHLRRNPGTFRSLMFLGFKAVAVLVIFWAATMRSDQWTSVLPALAAFSFGFGLAWTATFAGLYLLIRRRRQD